jgi:hypothetical protein
LCLRLVDSGAVVSPSSPDASLDDGCKSIAKGFVEVRFLLPVLEPADDGDDIDRKKIVRNSIGDPRI